MVLMNGFTGLLWSWWGIVLVGSCPQDIGPGGQYLGLIFIWWGIIPSEELS